MNIDDLTYKGDAMSIIGEQLPVTNSNIQIPPYETTKKSETNQEEISSTLSIPQDRVEISPEAQALAQNAVGNIKDEDSSKTSTKSTTTHRMGGSGAIQRSQENSTSSSDQIENIEKQIKQLNKEISQLQQKSIKNESLEQLIASKQAQMLSLQAQLMSLQSQSTE